MFNEINNHDLGYAKSKFIDKHD